jgi:hypothetical protein
MSDRKLMPLSSVAGSDLEQAVLSRVFIGPPYFALRPVAWQGGLFGAQAQLEALDTVGLSPEAQMLRHATLAGLCAGALDQPDDAQRHYIVQEIHYVVQAAPGTGQVELSAQVIDLDQRSLRAEVHVSSGAQLLASLNVLYTVLSGEAFERLFARRQLVNPETSPDWCLPLPGGTLTLWEGALIREVETLPAETCAGTSLGARALPASVLVGHLTALAAELAGPPALLASVGLQVNDLCWAGENLCFEVRPQEGAEAQDSVQGYAVSVHAGLNRRLVARGRLVLTRALPVS